MRTGEIIGLLIAAFPNSEWSKATIKLYNKMLDDIDEPILQAAVTEYIGRDHAFPPSIGQLRALATDLVYKVQGKLTAGQAWDEVTDEIKRVGYYGKPNFSDPNVHEAVERVGGWRQLCHSTNQVADRARFLDEYKEMIQHDKNSTMRRPEVRQLIARLSADRQLEGARTLSGLLGGGDDGTD